MNTQALDLSYLHEYTDGDQEMINELIEVFYETADEALAELKDALDAGDRATWKASAHKLKGASGYVGAAALKNLCFQAEELSDNKNEPLDGIFTEISETYKVVCMALKQQQSG